MSAAITRVLLPRMFRFIDDIPLYVRPRSGPEISPTCHRYGVIESIRRVLVNGSLDRSIACRSPWHSEWEAGTETATGAVAS